MVVRHWLDSVRRVVLRSRVGDLLLRTAPVRRRSSGRSFDCSKTTSQHVERLEERALLTPTVTLTASDPDASEAGPDSGTFSVMRMDELTGDLVVNYLIGGSATNGIDFQSISGSVTILDGNKSASIVIIPIPDANASEGSESVTISLSEGKGYNVDKISNGGTVTITDGTGPVPTVTITADDADASESGFNSGAFTISLSSYPTTTMTVNLSISGSATNKVDYAEVIESVSFSPTSKSATITIAPIQDANSFEGTETVVLSIADPTNKGDYTYQSKNNSATVTIADASGGGGGGGGEAPTVSITAIDPEASETGLSAGEFTISLSSLASANVTVNVLITGSALNGTDYATVTKSVVIPQYSKSATISIVPLQDADNSEGNETVVLSIAEPTNKGEYTYDSKNSGATVTIADASGGGTGSGGGGTVEFWTTPEGLAILAALTSAESDYQSALDSSAQDQTNADSLSLSNYQSAVTSAMQSQWSATATANLALIAAEALALATQYGADQAATQTEWGIESSAEVTQTASNQSAQNAYYDAVSAARQTQLSADSTSRATYQGVMDSASANSPIGAGSPSRVAYLAAMELAYVTYQAAQAAAATAYANSGSGSGGGGGFDLAQHSTYQAAVASANSAAALALAGAASTYSSAETTAWSTYQTDALPAYATYNSAVASNQANYSGAEATAQATFDSGVAANLAGYNASVASADDTKFLAFLANIAAEAVSLDAADTTYQAAIAANQATYESASTTAYAILQSALSTNTAAANGAYATAEADFNLAQANADTAYYAVVNDPNSTPTDIDNAWLIYTAEVGAAAVVEINAINSASQLLYTNNANGWNTYDHAINAAVFAKEQSDVAAAAAKKSAGNAADHAHVLADTSAENTYQLALNSYAELRALADAADSLTFSLALDAALDAQATADASAANTYAHSINGLDEQYNLGLGDANTAEMKANSDAYTQQTVSINSAAATAWSNWGSSDGSPYGIYQAAMNAATYTYNAAVAAINGSALAANLDAQNQWAHDVSGGWLTYRNDQADHAQTASDSQTTAAKQLTDAVAQNLKTYAITVAPAIQAAADAILNNGLQAIQSVAAAVLINAGAEAAAALSAVNQVSSAKLAANNALADHAEQRTTDMLTASNDLYGADLDAVGKLVSEAPIVIRAKVGFDALLKELVEKAALHSEDRAGRLWLADGVDGTAGFDCEDYADVLQRFLNGKFAKESNITVTFVTVRWKDEGGLYHGHVYLKVAKGGKFWFINPTRGAVDGPYNTVAELNAGITADGVSTWTTMPGTFEVTGEVADLSKLSAASNAWHSSSAMRQHFVDFCTRFKIDPRPFFPKEITPPEPTQRFVPFPYYVP